MSKKQEIALGIALQMRVLQSCPLHHIVYCREECLDDDGSGDGANVARAFFHAIELVRYHQVYAEEFDGDEHQLTDLLSATIAAAPASCPGCVPARISGRSSEAGAFH